MYRERRKKTQHPSQQETERTSTSGTRTATLQNAIYERERDQSDGLGAGPPHAGIGCRVVRTARPERDGRFFRHRRNTLLRFQYFTENKTKNTTPVRGSSTRKEEHIPSCTSRMEPDRALCEQGTISPTELVHHTGALWQQLCAHVSLKRCVLTECIQPLKANWDHKLASTAQRRRNDSIHGWWSQR